ncbi:cobalt-precorrin-7 (C5)-methyltransferase [Streptococcus rupicaprae]|uniref:Cobalt-precorrin-7 (C5)-methyltransferase n=1 Tax=Streptococcus rupicaprae TaxID=759619 RepID=A0ABV2FEZ8_9STRE
MDMIHVVGIGPGDARFCLVGQEAICAQADVVLGSERHLDVLPAAYRDKGKVAPKKLAELDQLLRCYPEETQIVYLVSGDPLIYGLGKWLSEKFPGRVAIQPGISAMQYLASKVCLPMNDAYLTSSHAKVPNFDLIMSLPKVFMVTDQQVGPYQIAQEAVKRGYRKTIIIGEQLSYDDERISILSAQEVEDRAYEMNVVVVLDEG